MSKFTAVLAKNARFHGNFTEGYLLFFEPPQKNHLRALIHKAYLRYLEAINVKMSPMVILLFIDMLTAYQVARSHVQLEGKYSLESTDPRESEFAPTCVRNSLLSHLS